jgi:hypothetical protein
MFFRRKKTDGADPRERALWGELTSFGMTFSLCIVLGFFLGRWIGGLLGHPVPGQWIGLAWGIASAFWELFKLTRRLDRYDQAQAKDQADREAEERQRPFGEGSDGE